MSENKIKIADLVKEVFIDPIRTVLVIDDEFPTLDALLEPKTSDASETDIMSKEADSLREILKFARKKEIPWLIDVHDGRKITRAQEKIIAPHLHHSDLMVLDYKLQGEEFGGTAAIEIIRKLATNNHFNLVIVYTKGENGILSDVLREITLGLTHKQDLYILSEDEKTNVLENIDAWEASDPGITEKLRSEVTDLLFLQSLSRADVNLKDIFGKDGGEQLRNSLTNPPKGVKVDCGLFLKWLFFEKQEKLSPHFFNINLGRIRINAEEDCCWISTEKVFIALISKQCSPAQFEEKLINAIVSSHPTPHRLLLTKMRSLIDQRGLVAEADILRDNHVQTAWLNDFLIPNPADVTSVISTTVSHHWEAMGGQLRSELEDFSAKLRDRYLGIPLKKVMKNCGLKFTDVNCDETIKRYNCFISTKPLDRGHLTTGHIFNYKKITKKETQNKATGEIETHENISIEYWVCLSAACDMVPGQKIAANPGGTGIKELLPFTAVRLHETNASTAIEKATDNLFVFIKIDDEVKTFSIFGTDGKATNTPKWERMFAADGGSFQSGTGNLWLTSTINTAGEISTHRAEATVIAQLRSEYALNLLQKLGTQLSRPGLGMHFKKRVSS